MPLRAIRRCLIVAVSASCLVGGLAGVADRITAGLGDGERRQFRLRRTLDRAGRKRRGDAVGPNHTFVIVYAVSGTYKVCVLGRGARACKSTATLTPLDHDSIFGAPQVYVSGNEVDVIMDECCAAAPETPVIFTSTNGGKTFGAPVFFGSTTDANVTQTVGTAVVVAGHLVWVSGTNAIVDSASLATPMDNEQTAASVVPDGSGDHELKYTGISAYKGGVLVAASNFEGPPSTTVEYAPAGKDPGVQSSYHAVGTFSNASFEDLEGGALITSLSTGSEADQIRFFNGTSFAAVHTVPDTSGGGPRYNSAGLSASGRVYVFTERNQDSYDLEVESTTNGTSWTARQNHGSADTAYSFNAALDSANTGIIVASPNPIKVYPVLATQSVTFKLSKKNVVKGHHVTAKGKSNHPAAGRKVRLERLESGKWHNIATTTESASGRFTFHLTDHSTGTFHYRAYVSDEPGYVQYVTDPDARQE
jgi:hypothetical protein